ncbi:hypothetical protein DAPPUDRAFT_113491 [Daphnia pulex]|uniref:Uncharacterized protein n=1 Tax=Daphnia pulex TaxID=6669 RepID=E9HF49_DAPPU|nr:hypothetical protein DAPPUDRAFT_113491 [Daphnia pulex]|eukprot:EFX69631.1 hypothetical protein DAPPUDRAFT_113491 [Daphnia pulex]
MCSGKRLYHSTLNNKPQERDAAAGVTVRKLLLLTSLRVEIERTNAPRRTTQQRNQQQQTNKFRLVGSWGSLHPNQPLEGVGVNGSSSNNNNNNNNNGATAHQQRRRFEADQGRKRGGSQTHKRAAVTVWT